MKTKPKQLRLALDEDIWEQLTEDAKSQCLELLSSLMEELWIATRGDSND